MKRVPFTSRRRFLAQSAAAIGFPTIVPASVFGQNAPSKKITMAVVGWGMMGPSNTSKFLGEADCQIVAACDIDKRALQKALDTVNGAYKNEDCKGYHDYREQMGIEEYINKVVSGELADPRLTTQLRSGFEVCDILWH